MATVLLQPANPAIYSDYTKLQAGIVDWSQREDLAAKSPTFIEMAERTMFREFALRSDETSVSGTTNGELIALPALLNAIERIEIAFSGHRYTLDYSSPNGIETLTGTTDLPTRYTIQNGQIRLISAPSGPFDYTIYYLPRPDFLSASHQSNALLVAHPDVYLWGALTELARYIMDQQMEASYLAAYNSAVSSIQRADERQRFPVAGGMQVKPRNAR